MSQLTEIKNSLKAETEIVSEELVEKGRKAAQYIEHISNLTIGHYYEDNEIGMEDTITVRELVDLINRQGIKRPDDNYSIKTIAVCRDSEGNIDYKYDEETSSLSYYDIVTEANKEFRIRIAGVINLSIDLLSLPVFTVALLADTISDELKWLVESDIIKYYVRLLHGERAYPGFWDNIQTHEIYMITLFETLFLSDIYDFEKARRITMRDRVYCLYPLPRKARFGNSLYACAKTVVDINPEEMERAPRELYISDEAVITIIESLLQYYFISIDELTTKQILKRGHILTRRVGSLKAIKNYYKNYKKEE